MRRYARRVAVVIFLWTCCALTAFAHKPSDSYLTLQVQSDRIEGQWDIALRDLDFVIGLDADGSGDLTWDEVRARHTDIAAYALSRLELRSGNAVCPAQPTQHLIDHHTDGTYEVLRFSAHCSMPVQSLSVSYRLFADVDSQHKGLLRLEQDGRTSTAIFGIDHPQQQFDAGAHNMLRQAAEYVTDGVRHIWTGYDHILFLLSLLLPAVFASRGKTRAPAKDFKAAFFDVLRVVTAFTVAHSITLTLATLHVVSLPSRWVESAIALSVVVAALNNIFTVVGDGRWVAAFVFGLVHGFGFASVLADLGLPQETLALSLVAFNVGVELGQLAIVAIFLPLAFVLRKTWFYRHAVLTGGSVLIAVIAAVWLVERAFGLQLT